MTNGERQMLQMLREDVESGFTEMREGFKLMNGRVKTLELKNCADEAVASDRQQMRVRISAERRWRTSFVFGLMASVAVGVLNIALNIVRP